MTVTKGAPDEEVEDGVDGTPDRVLNGQHRGVRQPLREGLEGHLELLAGQRLRAWAGLARCALAVRPWHALVCHPVLRLNHGPDLRIQPDSAVRKLAES